MEIGISGFTKATATMTVCSPEIKIPIPANPIDPPVLSMMFSTNKESYFLLSPFPSLTVERVPLQEKKDHWLREEKFCRGWRRSWSQTCL